MPAVIETSGLTKRYGATGAVADLNLDVEAAQVFGFLGPNGAGKTTTIRLLLALQRPTAGRARVLGLDPETDSVEIHRRVAYLPGELVLYPRMTGKAHIDWFASVRGGIAARRNADALVDRFGVVVDRPVRELSKGNRQKVGLVLTFMHHAELLVLDEPTSGLDPLVRNEFERLLQEVVAEGATVFLSSHDLDEVQRVANRVAVIKSGTLVMSDSVEALRERAPLKVTAEFPVPVAPAAFSSIDGVEVLACEGRRVELQVSRRPLATLLRVLADHDPSDVTVRRADLDELFLDVYREPSTS